MEQVHLIILNEEPLQIVRLVRVPLFSEQVAQPPTLQVLQVIIEALQPIIQVLQVIIMAPQVITQALQVIIEAPQVMIKVLQFAYEALQVMVGALQAVTQAPLNAQLLWIPQPRAPSEEFLKASPLVRVPLLAQLTEAIQSLSLGWVLHYLVAVRQPVLDEQLFFPPLPVRSTQQDVLIPVLFYPHLFAKWFTP